MKKVQKLFDRKDKEKTRKIVWQMHYYCSPTLPMEKRWLMFDGLKVIAQKYSQYKNCSIEKTKKMQGKKNCLIDTLLL